MNIVLNGEAREVGEGVSVSDLLIELELGGITRGVAVARNGDVVLRSSWPNTLIEEGDHLEVLHAVQGG